MPNRRARSKIKFSQDHMVNHQASRREGLRRRRRNNNSSSSIICSSICSSGGLDGGGVPGAGAGQGEGQRMWRRRRHVASGERDAAALSLRFECPRLVPSLIHCKRRGQVRRSLLGACTRVWEDQCIRILQPERMLGASSWLRRRLFLLLFLFANPAFPSSKADRQNVLLAAGCRSQAELPLASF